MPTHQESKPELLRRRSIADARRTSLLWQIVSGHIYMGMPRRLLSLGPEGHLQRDCVAIDAVRSVDMAGWTVEWVRASE